MSLAERIRTLKEATAQKETERRDRQASEDTIIKDKCNSWIKARLDPILFRLQEIGLEELLQEIKTQQPDIKYTFLLAVNYQRLIYGGKHWWGTETQLSDEQTKWEVNSLDELRGLDFADARYRYTGEEYRDIATKGKSISLGCDVMWNMRGEPSRGFDSVDTRRWDRLKIFVNSSDVVVTGKVESELSLNTVNRKQLENALFKAFTQPDSD